VVGWRDGIGSIRQCSQGEWYVSIVPGRGRRWRRRRGSGSGVGLRTSLRVSKRRSAVEWRARGGSARAHARSGMSNPVRLGTDARSLQM